MMLVDRVKRWWRRRRRRRAAADSAGASLREFVYLDEVSVYSLLASRLGPIASEFTATETLTMSEEFGTSLEGSASVIKSGIQTKRTNSQEQLSQVLRKSMIQTTFKELYELEAPNLLLSSASRGEPETLTPDDLSDPPGTVGWVTDASTLVRGRLIEVDVELQTEPVFRFSALMNAFLEILQEDIELFGTEGRRGVDQIRPLNRILEKLLSGLVPVRGRAVDFVVATIGERELILHVDVLHALPEEGRPRTQPLYVVGVAEQRLFWRDIRRVLFSRARYRMLCRIAQSNLQDKWSPVKLAEVIGVVVPTFESDLLGALSEVTLTTMADSSLPGMPQSETVEGLRRAAQLFTREVAAHHGRVIPDAEVARLADTAATAGGSLTLVDDRRQFFDSLLVDVDAQLGVRTSRDIAVACRMAAMETPFGSESPPQRALDLPEQPVGRILDTEIVAIYW